IQMLLLDEKGKTLEDRGSQLAVMSPPQYIETSASFHADAKRLIVPVKAQNTFSGPPAMSELIVRPELMPGLVEASTKDGVYRQTLTKAGQDIKLVANNLRFAEGSPRTGLLYVNADGIDRAFVFQADFSSASGTVPFAPVRSTAVRVAGVLKDDSNTLRL